MWKRVAIKETVGIKHRLTQKSHLVQSKRHKTTELKSFSIENAEQRLKTKVHKYFGCLAMALTFFICCCAINLDYFN
jgi:hypothetical protein